MSFDSETIFLLGAGFTKAVFPSAPLNKDLLGDIVKNSGGKLKKYQELYNTTDIERLLTLLDLEAGENEERKGDRSAIDDEIATYFSRFRVSKLNGLPSWLEIFARTILKRNDSIISLNYDCLLEGALDQYEVWSPEGGYARIEHPLLNSSGNPKNIRIFKIHGSENFRLASVIGKNPNQTSIEFTVDQSIYPKSGLSRHFGIVPEMEKGPYIIAPSFIKIPHVDITAMIIDALCVAKEARNLVIIGCSMRSEDNFLWILLTRFLNKILEHHRKQLILIGPCAETLEKRISNYWVGDIRNFANFQAVPKGIEKGIEDLGAIVGGNDLCDKQ